MLIRETKEILTAMLDAQVDSSTTSMNTVRLAVETFRRFAALPVEDVLPAEDDGDGVLAQYGTHDFRGQREFSTNLTRQFIEAGGQDAPMWQLSWTLYWPSNAATDDLMSGQLWSFGRDLDGFFDEAVALPGWAWALSGTRAPRDVVIMLDQV